MSLTPDPSMQAFLPVLFLTGLCLFSMARKRGR